MTISGRTVLEEIEELIPADSASFNEVDPLAGRATIVNRPRPATAAEVEVWQKWSHQNPSLMYMLRTNDGSARRISDFLTTDELHRLQLYVHVYGPLGIEHQLAVALPAPRPTVLGIALNRQDHDFTDDEVVLLDGLRPHLVQGYRRVQLMAEHRQIMECVEGALEEDGRAFHRLGEPLSGTGRSLLAHHYGPVTDQLPEPVQRWARQEQVGFARGGLGRLRQPLVSVKGGRRLTLSFLPGGGGPDLLWFVERSSETDASPLQRLGLSEREAEVLWLLTKGKPINEIAFELAISPGTVKKHLQHVYRKLGVSSATAAAAQAFDALAT